MRGRSDPPRAKIATAIRWPSGMVMKPTSSARPVERAGLVLDRRSGREQPLHPVLARLALGHHAEQVIAALGDDQLALVDAPQQLDHRLGRARIAAVPEVALVGEELRDRAVDAHPRGCRSRPASGGRASGPPTSLNRMSAARLSLWISILCHELADRHAMDGVVERLLADGRPATGTSAAIATLTVLAIGNGVSPLMLRLSPVLRSSAAMPTSAELAGNERTELLFDSRRSGDEAAAAGAARQTPAATEISQ